MKEEMKEKPKPLGGRWVNKSWNLIYIDVFVTHFEYLSFAEEGPKKSTYCRVGAVELFKLWSTFSWYLSFIL